MALAHSTLTAATIAKEPQRWTNMKSVIDRRSIGGQDLQVVHAGKLGVSSGNLIVLEGLTYGNSNCHITITPDHLGEWTYFHLTLVGGDGTSGYFELTVNDDDELRVRTSSDTVIGNEVKNVAKSQYFWTGMPGDLVSDINIIMTAFTKGHHEEGRAPG
jgi:hypothetical protein